MSKRREYVCPSRGRNGVWMMRILVDETALAWMSRTRKSLEAAGKEVIGLICVGDVLREGVSFVRLSDSADDELLESLYSDNANVMLGRTLAEAEIEDERDPPEGVEVMVKRKGVQIMALTPSHEWYHEAWLSWEELGVETDYLRCRYADCAERHPVAEEDEMVTCRTCRLDLGLA